MIPQLANAKSGFNRSTAALLTESIGVLSTEDFRFWYENVFSGAEQHASEELAIIMKGQVLVPGTGCLHESTMCQPGTCRHHAAAIQGADQPFERIFNRPDALAGDPGVVDRTAVAHA